MTILYLLQGLGQTPEVWKAVSKELGSRFSIRTIDSLNIGVPEGTFSIQKAARELEKEVEKNKEERKIICGLSLGAVIAAEHALLFPDNGIEYVLASFHPSPPPFIMSIQTPIFSVLWKIIRNKIGVTIEKQQFLSILHSVKQRDFSDELAQLKQRSVFVVGEKDGIHVKGAQKYGKLIPNHTIEIIPDAGHEINKEQPKVLASVLLGLDGG